MHGLDNLRAAAMLLGIALHAAVPFLTVPVPWIVHDASANPFFDLLAGVLHGFRTQLFFFLAGFFGHLLWRRLGTREFIRQRGIRIGLPFLLGMVTVVPLIISVCRWGETRVGRDPAWYESGELTVLTTPTCHLWFLEMLLVFYAVAAFSSWAGERMNSPAWLPRLDAAFDWFIARNWKPLLLMPLTVLCLWGGPVLGDADEAGLRLLPGGNAVAHFGLFFLVGWWLHRRRHRLAALHGWLKPYSALALVAFLAFGACRLAQAGTAHPILPGLTLLGLAAASLYAWLMVFVTTGWFLRFAGQHRPWVRYLAEASYWWYFAHLPLVLWLQVIVSRWPLNAFFKFAFIITVTVIVLVATYHGCVRSTWIGRRLFSTRTGSV